MFDTAVKAGEWRTGGFWKLPHCFSSSAIQMRISQELLYSFRSTGFQHVQPDIGTLAFSAGCRDFWFDLFLQAPQIQLLPCRWYLSWHKRDFLIMTVIHFIYKALFVRKSQSVTDKYKIKEKQCKSTQLKLHLNSETKTSRAKVIEWRKGELLWSQAVFHYTKLSIFRLNKVP